MIIWDGNASLMVGGVGGGGTVFMGTGGEGFSTVLSLYCKSDWVL